MYIYTVDTDGLVNFIQVVYTSAEENFIRGDGIYQLKKDLK